MIFRSLSSQIRNKLSNEPIRIRWVQDQISRLPKASLLLDAGCGSQQYRRFCAQLNYKAQDFGQYVKDEAGGFTSGLGGEQGYQYGPLDYVGDIWNIDEQPDSFDAILCTEVFEHIPYPNETLTEFARLLKPGGTLILTCPSNCLRHMDPFFFYSGFSDKYLEHMLEKEGFEIEIMEPVGDYYSWLSVELARSMQHHGLFAKALLFPAFLWYYLKKKTEKSVSTLCMGYHVVAKLKATPQ
jgi:SAM-dependent methyltransferase